MKFIRINENLFIFIYVSLCSLGLFLYCTLGEKPLSLKKEFENTFSEFEEMRDLIQTDPDIEAISYWTDKDFKIYFKSGKDVCSNFERYQAFFEKNKFVGGIDFDRKNIPFQIKQKYNMLSNEITVVSFTGKTYYFLFGYSLLEGGTIYCSELDLGILTEEELLFMGYDYIKKTEYKNWYQVSYYYGPETHML